MHYNKYRGPTPLVSSIRIRTSPNIYHLGPFIHSRRRLYNKRTVAGTDSLLAAPHLLVFFIDARTVLTPCPVYVCVYVFPLHTSIPFSTYKYLSLCTYIHVRQNPRGCVCVRIHPLPQIITRYVHYSLVYHPFLVIPRFVCTASAPLLTMMAWHSPACHTRTWMSLWHSKEVRGGLREREGG